MSNRREYLSVLAAGLATTVGGCLDDGGEEPVDETDEAATDDPTATGTGREPETTDERTDTPLDGRIEITGSSTVYPLAQAVVEGFRQQHPQVGFSLSGTGTGSGFSERFCEGNADFTNASRRITAGERQQCAGNGVEYHRIPLARDALTVVVNTDNDWVDCVTTAQLRQLWRADGATTWADVDSEWPDEEIERYGPAETSGTFDYFREAVLGDDATHTSDYAPTDRDNTILQGVQSDRYAVGYLGFSYYRGNSDAVRALGIDDGDGCVGPSLESAASGDYALARPLFTYVNTDRLAESHVAEFARYYVEQSANEELFADELGYVPNTEAQMQAELADLDDAIADAQ